MNSPAKTPISGFSITRPWPWVMQRGAGPAPLRLIYSTWALPTERLDTYVALHANINWDGATAAVLANKLGVEIPAPTTAEQSYNVVFAVAQWAACVRELDQLPLRQRHWFQDCYHWVLARFTVIEPVPCMPGGNFFKLPPEVLAAVRINYRKALNV